ncbi:claudin-11 isoform X1 [Lissotriton helveticus]
MASTSLQCIAFFSSVIGWIGVVVATATNDWIVTCNYSITTCRKLDQLGSRGLWADCHLTAELYHCKPLEDILLLPAYIQASRALMITASILGLPAVLLLLSSLPCIRMGHDPGAAKYKRFQVGGILVMILAICTAIATIWFPVCAHQESQIVTFGYSLYSGWIGAALTLLGGSISACCLGRSQDLLENRFYYSSQGSSTPTHAKSVNV